MNVPNLGTLAVLLASRMAWRSEPTPLSSVVVTRKVAGASRSSSASQRGRKEAGRSRRENQERSITGPHQDRMPRLARAGRYRLHPVNRVERPLTRHAPPIFSLPCVGVESRFTAEV